METVELDYATEAYLMRTEAQGKLFPLLSTSCLCINSEDLGKGQKVATLMIKC